MVIGIREGTYDKPLQFWTFEIRKLLRTLHVYSFYQKMRFRIILRDMLKVLMLITAIKLFAAMLDFYGHTFQERNIVIVIEKFFFRESLFWI